MLLRGNNDTVQCDVLCLFRRWLYGAVMDKGCSSIPSGKANKQTGAVPRKACGVILTLKKCVTRAVASVRQVEQMPPPPKF